MEKVFDVIIAGGGIAGGLAAAILDDANPDLELLLLEKDRSFGGRLRSTALDRERFGYGLGIVGETLFHFWDKILKKDPESLDLPSFATGEVNNLGILSGSKLTTIRFADSINPEGAHSIIGNAIKREWGGIEELLEISRDSKEAKQAFAKTFGGNKKSSAAILLEHLARLWGVANIWKANTYALIERLRRGQQRFYKGDWDGAFSHLIERIIAKNKLTLKTDCQIIRGSHEDGLWSLESKSGIFKGKKLLVAHSPWDSAMWLPKESMGPDILGLTLKTKPVSVLCISGQLVGAAADLDVMLFPAENVRAALGAGGEICFQYAVDYDLSHNNDALAKLVKRLHRARKKLLKAQPDLEISGDHLVLLPVGWSQSCNHNEREWLDKLDPNRLQSPNLAFCGDAYGPHLNGEKNLVESVNLACRAILSP